MTSSVLTEIEKKVRELPENLQRQVLIFVDALKISSTRGKSGRLLLEFAGTISLEDLKIMDDVIESGCEQVDSNEW